MSIKLLCENCNRELEVKVYDNLPVYVTPCECIKKDAEVVSNDVYEDIHHDIYWDARNKGYDDGHEDGYDKGYDDGYKKANSEMTDISKKAYEQGRLDMMKEYEEEEDEYSERLGGRQS